ncbi:MAG: RNA polymerase sigma-I factor [Candidatus Reconcilbacillus cellulovorans]|uniref:RNA polymerase sigma factor SigI n=1 Tax=Candidatus Reconcilbacillus cellulovorans TaxID=1906605 RepID=A0A2A6DZ09_9BACL|nr:MAG: RNA polymerase sigma-I factor [Candidatus Reconcilbacillus cellulovorans]
MCSLPFLTLYERFFGRKRARPDSADASPEEIVARIRQGDAELRNQFISDFRPYVAKVASGFCGRYVDPKHDDEFSVALCAFDEAIDRFRPDGGVAFLHFAESVIRRRLIDYVRKESRHGRQIPYSCLEIEDDEGNTAHPAEDLRAIEAFDESRLAEERRLEIAEFGRLLREFGITFEDLAQHSPRHEDSRKLMFSIGLRLARDETLMRSLFARRALPVRDLAEMAGVSKKTLERNRKYIIAVALIASGPFPCLREYIRTDDPSERTKGARPHDSGHRDGEEGQVGDHHDGRRTVSESSGDGLRGGLRR